MPAQVTKVATPQSATTATNTKKARVISKGLDRSLSNSSRGASTVQTPRRFNSNRKALNKNPRGVRASKFRGRSKKYFKNNRASNYEANMKITHNFNRALKTAGVTLVAGLKKPTNPQRVTTPVVVSGLKVGHLLPALRNTVVRQYQKGKADTSIFLRAQLNYRLRLHATYRSLRYLLVRAARLRASSRAALSIGCMARTSY